MIFIATENAREKEKTKALYWKKRAYQYKY